MVKKQITGDEIKRIIEEENNMTMLEKQEIGNLVRLSITEKKLVIIAR